MGYVLLELTYLLMGIVLCFCGLVGFALWLVGTFDCLWLFSFTLLFVSVLFVCCLRANFVVFAGTFGGVVFYSCLRGVFGFGCFEVVACRIVAVWDQIGNWLGVVEQIRVWD